MSPISWTTSPHAVGGIFSSSSHKLCTGLWAEMNMSLWPNTVDRTVCLSSACARVHVRPHAWDKQSGNLLIGKQLHITKRGLKPHRETLNLSYLILRFGKCLMLKQCRAHLAACTTFALKVLAPTSRLTFPLLFSATNLSTSRHL